MQVRNIRGRGDFWVAPSANSIRYDGGPWNLTVSILEFRGDQVARETIYVTQSWEARGVARANGEIGGAIQHAGAPGQVAIHACIHVGN